MSDPFTISYAERHGLDRLLAADPSGFAAAQIQVAEAGAAMPRPGDKESGPAAVFRPRPSRTVTTGPGTPDASDAGSRARMTSVLGFYEDPGQYAAALRRLA